MTAVAVGAVLGLGGCSHNPDAPDISAPSAAPAADDHGRPTHLRGIQLPETVSLSFGLASGQPNLLDQPTHVVLWTVNQAIKAQLNASYDKNSAATPDLKRLWSGTAYTAAYLDATAWIDSHQVPVGQVVVTDATVEALTATSSTVVYCQDMTRVDRGREKTNQLGPAIQAKNTDGTRVTLTLTTGGTKSTWQVAEMDRVGSSVECPPSPQHHPQQTEQKS